MIVCWLVLAHLPFFQSEFGRDQDFTVPLRVGVHGSIDWGRADRDADHATVAINARKDIAVVYHGDRKELRPPWFLSDPKQIECAIFRHQPGPPESWRLVESFLLGAVTVDPLGAQSLTSCARPDVIAVGDQFFVTWPRIYDESLGGSWVFQPAVLEAAWIVRSSAGYTVLGGSTPGAGIELDRHSPASPLHADESHCVPDAVNLGAWGGPGMQTAGVAYVHQTEFHRTTPGLRSFDIRFVACHLASGNVVQVDPQQTLITPVRMDGFGLGQAGKVLPDVTPGALDGRFWIAYEEIFATPSGPPAGFIRLGLFEPDSSGRWLPVPAAWFDFGDPNRPLWRWRPNLASAPDRRTGLEEITLSFPKARWTNDADVVFEHIQYSSTGRSRSGRWPGRDFPNAVGADDQQPVPSHGPEGRLRARCYVARTGPPAQLLEYDFDADRLTILAETSTGILQRPAVSEHFEAAAAIPYTVVVSYERLEDRAEGYRIHLRVR